MSEEKKEFTFENEEYRQTYWHTCSHIMAQAVKRLWPEVKLAIGPSIKEGWYYDMDAPFAFTPEHMAEIEAEMRKICKEKLKLERFELPREEAVKFMEEKGEPYKVELIQDLPEDAHISFYKQGEFTDLCAGPHLMSTGCLKAVKLTNATAAYWRGDAKNKGLQEATSNVYGNGHTSLFADMMDAIEHDRKPYVDAVAGRNALEMILAIYQSAATGKPVKLPLTHVASTDFTGRFDR